MEDYMALIKDLESASKVNFRKQLGELRSYCFGIARLYIASLLQMQAAASMSDADIEASTRWTHRGLYRPEKFDTKLDRKLAMDVDELGQPRGVGNMAANRVPRSLF